MHRGFPMSGVGSTSTISSPWLVTSPFFLSCWHAVPSNPTHRTMSTPCFPSLAKVVARPQFVFHKIPSAPPRVGPGSRPFQSVHFPNPHEISTRTNSRLPGLETGETLVGGLSRPQREAKEVTNAPLRASKRRQAWIPQRF